MTGWYILGALLYILIALAVAGFAVGIELDKSKAQCIFAGCVWPGLVICILAFFIYDCGKAMVVFVYEIGKALGETC